jgi:hypothetical protein
LEGVFMSFEIVQKFEGSEVAHKVAWTSAEGEKEEFQTSGRSLYIDVLELFRGYSLPYPCEDETETKSLTTRLAGKGVIDDRSIQVIGQPETKNKNISVSFWDLEPNVNHSNSHAASLGYMEHDWEIGNDAQWWVQIYLPKVQFQTLQEAVERGNLTKLSVGLLFENLYVTEWYAPPSAKVDWFLAPGKYTADLARGKVDAINIETKSVDLRPIAPIETEDAFTESEEHQYRTEPVDKLIVALEPLSKSIDGVTKYLKWIFWALVVLSFAVGGSR